MSIATATPRKNPAKPAAARAMTSQQLTGQALLDDMETYRKKIAATPESALDFLVRLGVMTRSGKPKKLIRG